MFEIPLDIKVIFWGYLSTHEYFNMALLPLTFQYFYQQNCNHLLRLSSSIINGNFYNCTKYFSGWNKWEVSSSRAVGWLGAGRLEQQLLKDVQESGSVCLLALPAMVCGFWPNDHSMPAVPPGEKKWGRETAFLQPRLYSRRNSLQRHLSLYFSKHNSIIWPPLASRESRKVKALLSNLCNRGKQGKGL